MTHDTPDAPLGGLNGRTVIDVGTTADEAALNPRVIAAPGYQMYLAGHHNTHPQYVAIDPGEGYPAVIAALEGGRVIANSGIIDGEHPPSDRAVIAALRLALYEGYASDDDALKVARAILDRAMPTSGGTHADQGVKLLLGMLRSGTLRAEVIPA